MLARLLILAAGLCGAAGVALSAVAAHGGAANTATAATFLVVHAPVLLVVGIAVFNNIMRWAAIVLILYIAGTSIIAHRFWEFAGPAQFGQLASFFKNLAMMGGLGLIAALGPGRYAVKPGS